MIAKELIDKNINLTKPEFKWYLNSLTEALATKLFLATDKECGISEVKLIEDELVDYQIMIFNVNFRTFNEFLYLNKTKTFKKFIYICYDQKHFSVIKSMKAFLSKSYFCDFCKIAYDLCFKHVCKSLCFSCRNSNCYADTHYIQKKCETCDVIFKNQLCEDTHFHRICSHLKKCSKCNCYVYNRAHVCGDDEKWCPNCKRSVDLEHKCYIQNEHDKKDTKKDVLAGYVFFDFESREDEDKNQVVNLAIAKYICNACFNFDDLNRCEMCQKIYRFNNINDFRIWSSKLKNTIQIAHNLKGYDGVLLLDSFLENMLPGDAPPSVIANGTKILSIKHINNIKYIDSASFLAMPLANFQKLLI